MMKFLKLALCFCLVVFGNTLEAQIVLLGDNSPKENVNDGNFELIPAGSWRKGLQSPHWKNSHGPSELTGDNRMGLFKGRMYSSVPVGTIESNILDNIPAYNKISEGDILNWGFGADSEYDCNAKITLSLVFGENERILAEKEALTGGDLKVQHFKGVYKVKKEDAEAGMPFVRARLYSNEGVKVFLNYVNISVQAPETNGPNTLNATAVSNGIKLKWEDNMKTKTSLYNVYRGETIGTAYKKIVNNLKSLEFVDTSLINGKQYHYLVTRVGKKESSKSPVVTITKIDKVKPKPPTNLITDVFDAEVKINWKKSVDKDVKSYSVYRGDANGENLQEIAHQLTKNSFVDYTPSKGINNSYIVYAQDYSGNISEASISAKAKVNVVFGTSFSDLILPMPIYNKLTSNAWGADGVLPRNIENGIEDPEWSYWGGRPVKDKDGKYHMCVTRWPANATKGHWEWPFSTVAHVVSEKPTGPYLVKDNVAYNFNDGLGHNPDVVLLNDGTFMLYSLVNWEATLFTSKSMNGPWKRLGVIEVDWQDSGELESRSYRFYRNLSGVQLDNGRFMFVTKAGAIMLSKGNNPLGPYKVLTKPIQGNAIIPEEYRYSNYEDPVLWKDDVQFHMIINAFWDYRAIYLRSPDGINWKFNLGTAYTPHNTLYEDGTQTNWYKLERPHVLQDEFGRATHLSLAVIDVPKRDDLAKDKHSSKNIIIPLIVQRRLAILNKEKINKDTKRIKILVKSETNFNAHKDIDIASLRYGASEEVDLGKGAKVLKTKKKGEDLLVEFDGEGNGITTNNFVGKLLGKTHKGELIIGYSKLQRD